MFGEPLFCRGVGLGLEMPLGQFRSNVVVGVVASVVIFLLNPWIYYGKIPASTLKYGLENPKNMKNSIATYIKQINDNNLITFIHHSP